MAINLTPSAIIGIILGVIISLAVVAIGLGFIGIFDFVVDEGSENNFIGLWANIRAMIDEPEPLVSKILPFYLMDSVIVVGYGYNSAIEVTSCYEEPATKPVALVGKGGLCLHKETNRGYDFDKDEGGGPDPPIRCLDFEEKVIFLAPSDNSNKGGFAGAVQSVKHPLTGNQEYESLFLYGSECDLGEPDLGATKLYLEVFKDEGAIYVYMNEHSTDEQIKANNERLAKLKAELV